ncbi:MAG TPA: TraR/DksA C4-type zinc finger protein [Verrucomicrobiae bacterium]|nr:TraR/DksA C4-type zinc finger protein [Verrucomicrobiae bacterium]
MRTKLTKQTVRKRAPRRKRAATADILGSGPPEDRPIPARWKRHYQRLLQVRAYLTSRQDDLVKDAKEDQSSFSLHMADAATDSFDRDFALSRASSEQEALYEIDEAIDRIRERTYGICELTGKPIDEARLEAIPWTRFSLEAEEILEREGRVQRAHLAPRAAVPRHSGDERGPSEKESE